MVRSARMILVASFFWLVNFTSSAWCQLPKLVVSYNSEHPGQLPPWIAKETGIFTRNGLDVQLIRVRSGVDIMSLVAGEVSVTNGGGAQVVSSSLKGSDAVIIAAGQVISDYVIVSQTRIKTAGQLKGGTFGVGTLRGLAMTVSRFALRKLGLDSTKDVSFFALGGGGASDRLIALRTGRIQATVLFVPDSIVAEKEGFNTLTDTTELPLPLNVVATTRRYIRENPDIVRKYIKSHIEAIHLMQNDRELALKVLAKYLKGTKDSGIIQRSYDVIVATKTVPVKQYASVAGIKTVLDTLAEEDPKISSAKPEQFLDMRFVKELDETGFIDNLIGKK